MEKRKRATEATRDRYSKKAFDWATGVTCVHMARFHLRNMGHRPPSLPRFRSAFAARKAMQDRGWTDVTAMLDSMLPRITPAAVALGDVVVVPGVGGIDAIYICAGSDRFFGWREDAEILAAIEVPLNAVTAAWRV